MITIINYGMGNLRSVQKAFERLRFSAKVTSEAKDVRKAERLVLPGVGHFSHGMKNLINKGFDVEIKEAVLNKQTPLLGICLGMQLLTSFSEEGNTNGLGLINATTKQFVLPEGHKRPHMGWNIIHPMKPSVFSSALNGGDLLYFVHSYFVDCVQNEDRLFSTDYGVRFDSGFQHNNIIGFQFHPEKSHKTGLQLLKKFFEL